jgi:hypothetical protein
MNELTAGSGQLQGTEANVIKSLIVKNHTLIGILNQLMDNECSDVIGFNNLCLRPLVKGRQKM